MKIKTLTVFVVSIFVFSLAVSPVLAGHPGGHDDSGIEVSNSNMAMGVVNVVANGANTGGNSISSSFGGARINTGDAIAVTEAYNEVNTNVTRIDDRCCEDNNGIEVENRNMAMGVGNVVANGANTGFNGISENFGSPEIRTGYAGAGVTAQNIVNSNLTVINDRCCDEGGNDCGPCSRGRSSDDIEVENGNMAMGVGNKVLNGANTGLNGISRTISCRDTARITTGDSEAEVLAVNVVNSNVTRINRSQVRRPGLATD